MPSYRTSAPLVVDVDVARKSVVVDYRAGANRVHERWSIASISAASGAPSDLPVSALSCAAVYEVAELRIAEVTVNGSAIATDGYDRARLAATSSTHFELVGATGTRRLERDVCPTGPPTAGAACEHPDRSCWWPQNDCAFRCTDRSWTGLDCGAP